jgi:aryl-alcohol dehydrogenase-like predicted oxidoreductase
MEYRKLGTSSLEVPVISFGAWAIGGWYWGGAEDAASIEALKTALDEGITAFDTAPVYGFGHSEAVLGQALAERRAEAVVMTKAGLRWDCTDGEFFFETADNNQQPVKLYRNSRPASLRLEVEASLRRLGMERIDLLQIHWPDPTTPIAESMGALLELRAEGKLREIGVSNFSPAQMDEARAALGDVPLASDQPKYNLLQRGVEAEVLPYVIEHHIGTLVYSPLEQGLLSGKVTAERTFPANDGRNKHPNFKPERRARVNEVLAEVVQPVADAHGSNLAQTVLAWTVAQPGVTSVLSGARTASQVRINAEAGRLKLTGNEQREIDEAFKALLVELAASKTPPGSGGLRGLLKGKRKG